MKKSIASEFTHALRNLKKLEMLLYVGLKRNSKKSKIDLLAGCDGGNIFKDAPTIQSLLQDHWPTGNFFVCDDSVRFDLPNCTGGVAVYDSALLARQIKGWIEGKNLEGQRRSWAIGYWLPEALCGDLATSEILYDAHRVGTQIIELVVPYPPLLSSSIICLCAEEIKQKIQMLRILIEKESTIELGLCVSDLVASMVRLAFARSRVYLRGFRSLGEQAKLLRSSDLSIYELAQKISKGEGLRNLIDKVERLI